MRNGKERSEKRQFFLFVMAGGFAVAVNLLTRVILSDVVSYRWAVSLAYLVGMATAFGLNKFFVFERSGKSIYEELVRFILVNLFGIIQVWCLSVWLAEYFFPRWNFHWHTEFVAHAVGVIPLIFTSYLGHKLISFAAKPTRKINA